MTAYYNEVDPAACEVLRGLIDEEWIAPGDVDERSIADVRPDDLRGYTQCHFFAGAGLWSLALRWAGWPDTRPVWTGSCPCQPFSAAGNRKGQADERHLWPEFARLIRECRPRAVFGEQVASAEVVGTGAEAAFLVAVQAGDYARANKLARRLSQTRGFHYPQRWVDGVQADLAAAGYAFRFDVLGAHSVGSPHIRQRLFWMADRCGTGCEGTGRTGKPADTTREGTRAKHPGGDGDAGGLGVAGGAGLQGHRPELSPRGDQQQPAQSGAGSVWITCRDRDPRSGLYRARRVPAESVLQRLADGHTHYVPAGDRTRGFPVAEPFAERAAMLKLIGNAIDPALAAAFVRAGMETRE